MRRSLLAAENYAYFRTFMIASTAGVVSLFPLLFTPAGKSPLIGIRRS
jgi:alpha-1,3-glucosyltransferase